MKRGPKPELPSVKEQRGTFRPGRDGWRGEITTLSDPPAMPEYLTPEAQEVWLEEMGRVISSGVSELDSSLFARYCSLEALIRKAFRAGEPPPAAYLSEGRRMAELLGIAGPRVRLTGKSDGANSQNPFARNGVRTR